MKKLWLAVCFASLLAIPVRQAGAVDRDDAADAATQQYWLHLYDLHTSERIDIMYRQGSVYLPGALTQLSHFLRDHRTNAVKAYDPSEFDLLHDLMARLGKPDGAVDIVCGYRSQWSNQYLRDHTVGVALHSQHLVAKAIDIRVPGVSTERVREAALSLHRGGVGYYPESNFVHLDVGPVRQWELTPSHYGD